MEADMQCPTSPARPISNHTDASLELQTRAQSTTASKGVLFYF